MTVAGIPLKIAFCIIPTCTRLEVKLFPWADGVQNQKLTPCTPRWEVETWVLDVWLTANLSMRGRMGPIGDFMLWNRTAGAIAANSNICKSTRKQRRECLFLQDCSVEEWSYWRWVNHLKRFEKVVYRKRKIQPSDNQNPSTSNFYSSEAKSVHSLSATCFGVSDLLRHLGADD